MRTRIKRASARDIAAGLAHALEALRASASLAALEVEVAGLGGWVLRVSAGDDCEPVVTVEKDEGATAS